VKKTAKRAKKTDSKKGRNKGAPTAEVAPTTQQNAQEGQPTGEGTPKKAQKAKKTAAPKKERKMSGLDAAAKVLAEAGAPMNTKDIVETAATKGYWKTNGKTPAATIYAAIIREIATKGKDARFKKTDRGLFTVA